MHLLLTIAFLLSRLDKHHWSSNWQMSFCLLVIWLTMPGTAAQAQLKGLAPAHIGPNTAADAMLVGKDSQNWCTLKAMVWDGPSAGLMTEYKSVKSLTPFGTPGFIPRGLRDPDLVVVPDSTHGEVIHVVGIDSITDLVAHYRLVRGRTSANNCQFVVHSLCYYGRAKRRQFLPTTAAHNHSITYRYNTSPNIDANSLGQLAVVWVEHTEAIGLRQDTLPNGKVLSKAVPTNRGLVMVVRGKGMNCLSAPCADRLQDVDAVAGEPQFLNLTPNEAHTYNGMSVSSTGSPVGYPDDQHEEGLTFHGADVAVSERCERDDAVRIIVCYNTRRTLGPSHLEVVSFEFNMCNVENDHPATRGILLVGTVKDVFPVVAQAPRISKPLATTRDGIKSYAVVWAKTDTLKKGTATLPATVQSSIMMAGRHGKMVVNPVVLYNGPKDMTHTTFQQPVIAYRAVDYADPAASLVVMWSVLQQGIPTQVFAHSCAWNGTPKTRSTSLISGSNEGANGKMAISPALSTRLPQDIPLYGWFDLRHTEPHWFMSATPPGNGPLTPAFDSCEFVCGG